MRKTDWGKLLRENAVTIMFVFLTLVCLTISMEQQPITFVLYELFGRLSRNAFIVLALIIPIVAGMGINFAITIGAMAAQIAVLVGRINKKAAAIGGRPLIEGRSHHGYRLNRYM